MLRVLCIASILVSFPLSAQAAEVCGDGLDNNSDGQADEGCWPAGVTGVCESPLSCAQTGAVSPKKGALVYRLPPDLAPKVAYGPGISFQRVYTSQFDPNVSFPSYRAPMGYRFQHNYMSWLELDTSANPDQVVLHTTKGQDVLFTYDSTSSGYDYYTPQPGYHFDYLRQKTTGSNDWELRTLTGSVLVYSWSSPVGKLKTIEDSGGNQVSITYNGNGQVDKVEDATGKKFLSFSYQTSGSGLLNKVEYYTTTGTTDTKRVTVSFTYTSDKLDLVKIDGTTIQDYAYGGFTTGYVSAIDDGEGNQIAAFTFDYDNPGTVSRIDTPKGDVGYAYGASGCDSGNGTYVYYHRASSTSCDTDNDCSSGEYCGGITTRSGASLGGSCYKVRQCVTVDSTNEDLVDSVSASCASCLGTADYEWDTGTSGEKIDLSGTESADSVWTSYSYNSDGLVTKMVEDDTDSDASTVPSGARVTYYKYGNATYPGLVTEVRRLSELKPSGSCDASTTTDCKRTLYTYTTAGLLDTVEEIGFTYNSSGSVTSYDFTTDYDYDSVGRLTDKSGPRAGVSDDVSYTYWTSGDELQQDYLKDITYTTSASSSLTITLDEYDYWGNPVQEKSPDSNITCRTYDGSRGYLAEQRVVMGSETDCASTPSSSDLTTSYTRDTWLRLTQVEKPKGNCWFWEYDSEGRIQTIKSRDDCTASSSGDDIVYTYSLDGLRTKVQYKNSSGTVTYEHEVTYREDRRVDKVINPEDESYRTLTYDDDGMPASVTLEDGVGATEWDYDDLNREEELRRYTDGTGSYDTWMITPGVQLDLPTEVEDSDSKAIDWVWDDLGRKVKQVTPDSGTTIYVYDEAGNLTTMVEASGDAGEVTHTFSYDLMNRLTEEDYGSIDCGANQEPEIQYVYDAQPGTCPTGAVCDNLEGRLAYVKSKLWCDTNESDDTFDQETYFSYDKAGRKRYETIEDDAGRDDQIEYTWNDNGSPTEAIAPSGAVQEWTYGHSSQNSDADNVAKVQGGTSSQTIAYKILRKPFGPIRYYLSPAGIGGYYTRFYGHYDLAYRPEDIYWHVPSHAWLFRIDYAKDSRGRITSRDFSYAASGVQDAYYTYDNLSRVTCDSGTTGTCPTSGSDLKSNLTAGYTASGEREELIHDNYPFGDTTYTVNLGTGSDQIESIDWDSYTVNFGWDDRGNRTYDDNASASHDRRDYTYDGRGNVLTVSGEYYTGSAWHDYTMTNAYDHKNRRVFKSFLDEDSGDEAQWLFYYDVRDRLLEAKYVPDVNDTDTYQIFDFYWVDDVPIAYYQLDYPGASETRRVVHADEIGRPLDVWSWPSSGNIQRVWAINPDLFGWDEIVQGESVYQPLRFPGQYRDEETQSTTAAIVLAVLRPALHENRNRYYDPFTGTYLQVDPLVEDTWESYNYVEQNPVMNTDSQGTWIDKPSQDTEHSNYSIGYMWSWYNANPPDFEIVEGLQRTWIPGGAPVWRSSTNPQCPSSAVMKPTRALTPYTWWAYCSHAGFDLSNEDSFYLDEVKECACNAEPFSKPFNAVKLCGATVKIIRPSDDPDDVSYIKYECSWVVSP